MCTIMAVLCLDLVIDRGDGGKDAAVCLFLWKKNDSSVNTVDGKTNKVTDRHKHKTGCHADRQI